jgi:hypothetical protein
LPGFVRWCALEDFMHIRHSSIRDFISRQLECWW